MVVTLRLKRFGRLNHPTYRLCAADSRCARDGRIIETLGHYLPKAARVEDQVSLNADRVGYWLSVGAQPSETARSLIHRSGIALPVRKKRVRGKSKAKAKPFVPPRKKGKAKAKAAAAAAKAAQETTAAPQA